ncbi:phosphatidylinositol N-acetylglucosaminyltransferase-domain-containing protein [Limtongia smithiae]|uniref:phosphatidylinositol N-acetylglucosaminyltransferase-domain-containing protein n=1 Tax=Limtongia smithiae TaxID=1125753 RepID=UPI0034CE8E26
MLPVSAGLRDSRQPASAPVARSPRTTPVQLHAMERPEDVGDRERFLSVPGFAMTSTSTIITSQTTSTTAPRRRPWHKLLWVHQPYPDNYVDASFLSQLKRNLHVQQYSFWALSSDSTVIILHASTVMLFVCVFVVIYNLDWDPAWFAATGSTCTLVGYAVWDRCAHSSSAASRAATAKSAALIVSTLLGLSPVLKSLTQSTSSDSIWAISVWLFLLNIFFHDYSAAPARTAPVSASSTPTYAAVPPTTLSTNLAIAAAIVLASRLSTTLSVFSFLLFSIELFGLFPIFSRWLRTYSFLAHLGLTAVFIIVTECGMFRIGGWWAFAVWTAVLVSAAFIAPGWLIALQKYKNEIQGPWDPAKPVLRSGYAL